MSDQNVGNVPILGQGPTPAEAAIIQRLDLLRQGVNTLIGQLDMSIRLQCGQTPDHVVKSRLNKFDAEQAAAQAEAEIAATEAAVKAAEDDGDIPESALD